MSITSTELNKLREKAKGKRDGVYSSMHIIYVVKNNYVKAYARRGEIFEILGMFTTKIGHYDYPDNAKRLLKSLLTKY